MNLPERRDIRIPFPELFEWMESPMFGFRPFGKIIRVEDHVVDGRYVLRAELPAAAKTDDVKATYNGGVLEVGVGLAEGKKAEGRRIAIEH